MLTIIFEITMLVGLMAGFGRCFSSNVQYKYIDFSQHALALMPGTGVIELAKGAN